MLLWQSLPGGCISYCMQGMWLCKLLWILQPVMGVLQIWDESEMFVKGWAQQDVLLLLLDWASLEAVHLIPQPDWSTGPKEGKWWGSYKWVIAVRQCLSTILLKPSMHKAFPFTYRIDADTDSCAASPERLYCSAEAIFSQKHHLQVSGGKPGTTQGM